MNTRISFRNMEHNVHVEEHAHRELAKLDKFFQPGDQTVSTDLVISVEGVDHRLHRVELRVHDKHGELVAHELGRDIYLTISQVTDKMIEELSKGKSRRLELRDKPTDENAPVRKEKADFEK